MEEKMAGRVAVAIADNIISPLGLTSEENYMAVKDGRTGVVRYAGHWGLPDPFMAALIDRESLPSLPDEEGLTIFEKMVLLSIRQALSQCDVDVTSKRTQLVLSTTKGNVELLGEATTQRCLTPSCPDPRVLLGEAAKTIARYLGNPNLPIVVSNACISGVCAQIEASRLLQTGRYDHVIVCGADVLSPFIVSGFQSLKALTDEPCRPFDIDRTGINLGDAAATIIYQGVAADAQPSGAWVLVKGAIRNDAHHISSPSPTGDGCYNVLREVMQGTKEEDIALINAHGTATLFNDEMESVAIFRAGLSQIPVNSLKGYFGHTMGAAGILETIISMRALNEGIILPTKGYECLGVSKKINIAAESGHTDKRSFIKMISGFGGCNAAILFRTVDSGPRKTVNCQLKTSAEVEITTEGMVLNGQRLTTSGSGSEMLTDAYRRYVGDYPKFFKMDGLSKLGFLASELLLQQMDEGTEHDGARRSQERFILRDDRAVILFNRSGSIEADVHYQSTISDPDNFFPSPSVFVYTLPNIVTGEIAIRNKYQGETSFFVLEHEDQETIQAMIEAAFEDEGTKSVLAGWVDYSDGGHFEAKMRLMDRLKD